jgi:hypothetical protein
MNTDSMFKGVSVEACKPIPLVAKALSAKETSTKSTDSTVKKPGFYFGAAGT